SLGSTGFRNVDGYSSLVFGFPYSEAPKTYIRKLSLAPAVQAFEKMEKGGTKQLVWEIKKGNAKDYSDFIAKTWTYCYDTYKPLPVKSNYTNDQAKKVLTNFFKESYVDKYPVKYYSGVELHIE